MKLLVAFFLLFNITLFNCEDATSISPNEYCTFLEGNTQWYTFTTISPITVNIITASNGEDGKMELYKGDCDDLEFLYYDDNSGPFLMPQIDFETEANTTYYVKVYDVEFFEICVFNCTPLPVELIEYKIENYITYLKLKWVTASEINNWRFNIYYSEDHLSWRLLSPIPGANNSVSLRFYTYSTPIVNNKTVYYKLTQTDYNGVETELGILPFFSKKEFKKIAREIDISGNNVTKDYHGVKFIIYQDGSVNKIIEFYDK